MSSAAIEIIEASVPAQVRYINAEWKARDESPRIGSRESRRAATSFQDVRVHDARPRLEAGARAAQLSQRPVFRVLDKSRC